jgi:hypothetical protein
VTAEVAPEVTAETAPEVTAEVATEVAIDAMPDAPPTVCTPEQIAACDDDSVCTLDACAPADGSCSHEIVSCNDGIPCTGDACDTETGCYHQAYHILCDDGVDCTVDACDLTVGCTLTPDAALCPSESSACQTVSCHPKDGCQIKPKPNAPLGCGMSPTCLVPPPPVWPPAPGLLGAPCQNNTECDSGVCLTDFFTTGAPYCSATCAANEGCSFTDLSEGTCLNFLDIGTRCIRTCEFSACPEGHLCSVDASSSVDFCADWTAEFCSGDADCAGDPNGETACDLVTGGKNLVSACQPPYGLLPPGSPCDGTPPAPCSTDPDCPSGWSCDTAAGSCELPFSERCTWLCIDGFCASPCTNDLDCAPGLVCNGLGFFVDQAATLTDVWGVCRALDGSLGFCDSDLDCPEEEVCSYFLTGTAPSKRCLTPAAGELPHGSACAIGAQCHSGRCNAGVCGAACGGQGDCAAGSSCLPFESGAFCWPYPTCGSAADCVEGVCRPAKTTIGLLELCLPPVGDLEPGAACDPELVAPLPAEECTTGVCNNDGHCGTPCAEDVDCPSGACLQLPFAYGDGGTPVDPQDDEVAPVWWCRTDPGSQAPCTRDADCTGGEICRFSFDPQGLPVTRCVAPPANQGATGDACGLLGATHQLCVSDYCLSGLGQDTGQCTAPCAADTDCPSGWACDFLPVYPDWSIAMPGCLDPATSICGG